MVTSSKSQTTLFSTVFSGRTNAENEAYKKIFASRTVRKLSAIQFINGLFLIVLHMSNQPYYNEAEDRKFEGGFLSGRPIVIVIMVLFYWITGITGIIWTRPIRSRPSLCYLMIVIFISSTFSAILIINSILGLAYLSGCISKEVDNKIIRLSIPNNETKTRNDNQNSEVETKEVSELILEYNCTSLINSKFKIDKFRISTEEKILVMQIALSSIYLILKALLFVELFRKFESVYGKDDPNQTNTSQPSEQTEVSNMKNVVCSACLCCLLNVWSVSCKHNKDNPENQDIPMTFSPSSEKRSDLSQTETSE
jgi:hypothetical protein